MGANDPPPPPQPPPPPPVPPDEQKGFCSGCGAEVPFGKALCAECAQRPGGLSS